MPNWCHNCMKITGAAEELVRFKQVCFHEGEFDFAAIIPIPPEAEVAEEAADAVGELFYAAVPYWGTKWNACDFRSIKDDPDCLEFNFDTAWSPPVPVFEKIGEMFPHLEFKLSGYCVNDDGAFRGTIHGGVLKIHAVPMVCETINPKTGEIVRGSLEEIETVLGAGLLDECGPVRISAAEDA